MPKRNGMIRRQPFRLPLTTFCHEHMSKSLRRGGVFDVTFTKGTILPDRLSKADP